MNSKYMTERLEKPFGSANLLQEPPCNFEFVLLLIPETEVIKYVCDGYISAGQSFLSEYTTKGKSSTQYEKLIFW